MSTDTPGTHHVLGAHGAMRPQLRLVAANGHDHGPAPLPTPRPAPGPAVVPLGRAYVDVDLAAIERHAQRRAERRAEREAATRELDELLRQHAEAHISQRGTLLDMPGAARWVLWLYLGCVAAVAALGGYAWWLQR